MKIIIYSFLAVFVFIFSASCGEKRQNDSSINYVVDNVNIDEPLNQEYTPNIELNEYTQEIIDSIIEKDLEKLVNYFGDVVYFGDDTEGYNVFTRKEWDYNGFLNEQGELYAVFFNTEMLNDLNEGENRYGHSFFQGKTICIREALSICNLIKLNFEVDIYIDLIDKSNHNSILIRFNNQNKIKYIDYNYYPNTN